MVRSPLPPSQSSPRLLVILGAILAALVILAGSLIFLLWFGIPGRGCSKEAAHVSAAVKSSPEIIARQLFTQYLESCLDPLADNRKRLEDYQIDSISISSYRGNGFVFTVIFSIKPAGLFTEWIAGNGLARSDGWIERKLYFVHVVQLDGDYRIEGMGTGP